MKWKMPKFYKFLKHLGKSWRRSARNMLKMLDSGGYIMAKKPLKKTDKQREEDRRKQRLRQRQEDAKCVLLINITSLRETLRLRNKFIFNMSRFMESRPANYKEIEVIAEEVERLNNKLERFL